jgi:CDP-diacylglycerol--glycerol-3-phosphate 3-phosphatidyltransferase
VTTLSKNAAVFNVPNALTAARLALSIGVFALIAMQQYVAAIVVFVLAASTDWIDGYWARKYGQVTKLGRIFDPFVDKVIICGTFIYLAAEPNSGIAPWMAVLVMAREMLVTALRSFIEQSGGDFSAKWAGKLKMVFQCAAVVASLLALWYLQVPPISGASAAILPMWLSIALVVSVWLAIISTVYSGVEYIVAASRSILE